MSRSDNGEKSRRVFTLGGSESQAMGILTHFSFGVEADFVSLDKRNIVG